MQAIPQQSDKEARTNRCFEALLWALSRPGQVRDLPEVGEAQIIEALLDRECCAHLAPGLANDEIVSAKFIATRAERVEIDRADHVFVGHLDDCASLSCLKTGSDLYPDDGATLVVRADIGFGQRVRLSGPGVDGSLEIGTGRLPLDFWSQRARLVRYPMGFEIFLLDGNRVIGIPRSTKVEIV
ncbi:phosphonate C-P lyase system protein PhnH [uncultured Cohaesibacter sp.]|uniref:phosphonate C-P lyase system protein PhnH n=1 Tax=uncultured Cohaesibacter sp. TaxID=1002546 RepID=UPI00292CEBE6|nr:phosphonate C-P lyase system protein PhnH [uncultured Cohaesibacter sp.]